nr:zinc finger, CCHC-type [Tanacetum cinerariifolium]
VCAIAWWIDSGATTYVGKDHCWFKTFELVKDGYILYMGDKHFTPVHGKGSVALEYSSGKTITLFNVLYVPKLRKNLVSGPVLNKCGYKQVYYKRMLEMSKDELIPAIDENSDKCTTYRGGEYYDPVFFQSVGFIQETTAPYTPQQIGVAERKNKALKEMINSMLSYLGLSEGIWGEAMLMACYLLNNVLNKRNKTTPYELWLYVIEPNDSVSINSIIESRDAIFNENRFSSIPRPKDIILNVQESQIDNHIDDVPSEILEPQKVDDEIGSIMENNTWVLSYLSPGCKTLDIHNLVIYQMDVKTAFLNGDLDDEVYMKQPKGFVMPGNEHKVCKLVKSLSRLKQAPKQWHQKFDEVVLSSCFHLNQSEKCVYSKFDNSDKGVIICLYVDDMLIFRTDQNQVDNTKKFLSSRFSMKDMGEADVFLGIKIKHENKGIVITQFHYIVKILKKFNRKDCSPVSTPMDPVEKLKPNTGKPVDQLEYSRAIGCLMYAMTSTRPDIAYVVGRLSGFTSNPSRQHWKAITMVLKGCENTGHTPYPNLETTEGTTLLSEVKPHILAGRRDMDLFDLIRAPNPTKVKTVSRPRAAHEVPLLTVTANRVIEMEDPAAATDSSRETATPEVPPPENVPIMGGAPEAGPAERVAATDLHAVKERHKRGHDGVDINTPPKVLRRDHADPRPTESTREGKSLAAIELGMGSTRPTPAPQGAPADVSDPNPLSFADPQSRPSADVAQSSKGAAVAGDPESENTSFASMVGSPESIYRPE